MTLDTYHLTIGGGRRIVLPSEICQSLNVTVGDTIILRMSENGAQINSVDRAINRFQRRLQEKLGTRISLVDELIAEREASASHE